MGGLIDFFEKRIWAPDIRGLGGLKASLLRWARLLYAAVREIYAGQLTTRAASLAYTTLVSLIPLLAVSFSVLKAFGVHYQIEPLLYQFLSPLGPKGADLMQRITGFVDNVNAGVLGSLGIVTLIYTAVSVVQKIENSVNHIWRVPRQRSFLRMFSDYTSMILIGPVLIVSAIGITASVLNTHVAQKILAIKLFGIAVYAITKIIPYLIVCTVFTFVYVFIPNTKVNLRSALAGGVFSGILWQTSGWAFASFTVSSKQYSAIYSGFAIVILFMLWVYLGWVIFLTGSAISFYHQYPHLMRLGEQGCQPGGRVRERLAFFIMLLIGYSHYHARPLWSLAALVERLSLPAGPVLDTLEALKKKRLVIETCDNPPLYLPARDIETIKQREIIEAVRTDGDGAYPAEPLCTPESEIDSTIKKIDEAVGKALGEENLKTLVLSCREERR